MGFGHVSLTMGLQSHSIRRGAAQYVNSCKKKYRSSGFVSEAYGWWMRCAKRLRMLKVSYKATKSCKTFVSFWRSVRNVSPSLEDLGLIVSFTKNAQILWAFRKMTVFRMLPSNKIHILNNCCAPFCSWWCWPFGGRDVRLVVHGGAVAGLVVHVATEMLACILTVHLENLNASVWNRLVEYMKLGEL